MPSLLDSQDPVLSLLGNLASLGRMGPDAVQPQGAAGDPMTTSPSPLQRQTGLDALAAAGQALSAAAAPGFGPRQTVVQGLSGALGAGRAAAIGDEAMQQATQDAQFRRQILQRQFDQQQAMSEFVLGALRGRLQSPPDHGDGAAADPGPAPGYTPGAAVRDQLGAHEGGARGYQATNAAGYSGRYQLGAGLAADSGIYQPAEGENVANNEWKGSFQIPGFPAVKTRDDFLATPAAQDAAYSIGMGRLDQQLQANGVYDRGLGQTIGGVPVTRDGLLAGAWLGGPSGVKAWVDSNGSTDARDSNRTPISRWVALGAPAAGAPARTQFAGPGAPPGAPPGAAPGAAPGAPGGVPISGLPAASRPPQANPASARPDLLSGVSTGQLAMVAMLPPDKQAAALLDLTKQQRGTMTLLGPDGRPWMFQQNPDGTRGAALGPVPHEVKTGEFRRPDGSNGVFVINDDGTRGRDLGDAPTPPASQPLTPQRQQQDLQARGSTFEPAFAVESGKQAAQQVGDLRTAREKASQLMGKLDTVDAVLKSGYQTNALAPRLQTAGGIASALGIDLGAVYPGGSPKDVVNAELMTKASNSLLTDMLGDNGFPRQNFSNTDRDFVAQTLPNIANRPESNMVISAFMRAQAQRSIDKAQGWQDFRRANADQYKTSPADAWQDYEAQFQSKIQANPIVHTETVNTADEARALPPGTIYHRPDGRWGVTPRPAASRGY